MLITVEEANSRLQAKQAVLIDVRESKEWVAAHVEGAQHFALSTFDPTALNSAASYMVICRSGGRSGKAMTTLHEAGFDAVNVDGGMLAWAEAGLPMCCESDETPVVIEP
jgi:rhodanese-related sulfurtransferase